MTVQHVELGDICSNRKRYFIDTKTTAAVSGLLGSRMLMTNVGLGKYGLRLPISWKILAF